MKRATPPLLHGDPAASAAVGQVSGRRRGRRLVIALAATVLLAVGVRTQLVDTVRVASDSMAPTVCAGDIVVLAKVRTHSTVAVDDIVTFLSPEDGTPTIKRVVGTAGQSVAIADAQLVRDGQPIPEPYVDQASIDGVYYGPVTVPEGSVLVMGDHREVSVDSRTYGPIPLGDLDGRLLATLWSSCDG